MITYRLTSKSISPTVPLNKDEVRRIKILARASKKCARRMGTGTRVAFNSSPVREAVVVKLYTNLDDPIHWKGDKPFFIRIKFDDNGQEVLTHSSSLRVIK